MRRRTSLKRVVAMLLEAGLSRSKPARVYSKKVAPTETYGQPRRTVMPARGVKRKRPPTQTTKLKRSRSEAVRSHRFPPPQSSIQSRRQYETARPGSKNAPTTLVKKKFHCHVTGSQRSVPSQSSPSRPLARERQP